MNPSIVDKSVRYIENADAILIGAGAGLTAAAGINFTDKEAFAKHFPAWKKRGFEMQYQLMGYRNWNMAEQWGYYTVHLGYVYYGQGKNEVYQTLRNIVADKPYFIMTSNVDGMFQKNDFDKDKVYEPQGSYGKIQCTVPCKKTVWDMKPFYDNMLSALDPHTQVLTDDSAIPKCPNCGEDMFIHARIDGTFIDEEHSKEVDRLNNWLSQYSENNLLLLELGAGYNTPMVIRYPMEKLNKNFINSKFIRVNMEHAQIDNISNNRTLGYQGDIKQWLNNVSLG